MTAKELDLPSLHERAASLAELAHYGQVDKINAPYVEHVQTVAAYAAEMLPEFEQWQRRIMDPVRAVTTALLHDTIEDTWVTPEILRSLFPESVCEDVWTLSMPKRKRITGARAEYCRGILEARSLYPLLVKAADLRHNTQQSRMMALTKADRERLARKYTDDVEALDLDHSPFAGYFYHLEDFLKENGPA